MATKPPDVWQHKLVHKGIVIAEGSQVAMGKLRAFYPASFVALSWHKSMIGQPWRLAAVPRATFDSKTLLASGHNSTI